MVDPITAEIVRNYMETVAAEVIQTMVRTSVNPIFNEAHDCSAGVFYYDGDEASLIARADAVPVHIYATLTSVQTCLDFFHGDLSDGDILIVSDPYYGGTHIPDYTVVKPVFYEGQPVFFPGVRAHTLDSGGPVPGGYSLLAREIWHEGFRFAPMKLYEKGHLRREVWDMLRGNNRLPDIIEADMEAMIGGCRVGEDRIRRICSKYGLETVRQSVEWVFDYSEQRFRDQIRRWPDGIYEGESILDTDFAGRYDVPIKVSITIDGDELTVDFSGTADQSDGIVNSPPGNTVSYIYGAFSAICADIPINSGFFRPIKVNLPEGSLVNPLSPAPVAYSTVCIGADIGDAIMNACENFAPERVGTASLDLCVQWTYGVDGRNGQFFIQYDYHTSPTCSGATYGVDGWGAWAALFCALKLSSLEMTEVQYPCFYWQAELLTDSAAPGEWRGSPAYGARRQPYNAATPLIHDFWVQALRNSLVGFKGGRPGAGNYAIIGYDDESPGEIVSEVAFNRPVANGQTSYFQSGGGGGWGDPLDRDVQRVLDDVLDEYVSVEGARHDYGVVIDQQTMTVDEEATERERAALRETRKDDPGWLALGRKQTLEAAGVLEWHAPTGATA
jgi:N-methylhydantoinase B